MTKKFTLFLSGIIIALTLHSQDWVYKGKTYSQKELRNTEDFHGESVSIDGNFAVIGAPSYLSKGAAFVMEYDGSEWKEIATLLASDGELIDNLGYWVSISGNTIVLGAFKNNVHGPRSGAAYVYEKPAGGWKDMTETTKLTTTSGNTYDYFGCAVSISGDNIVVGALKYDFKKSNSGAAFVYEKPAKGWGDIAVITESAILYASDASDNQSFGRCVSISGNFIVVGANKDDENGENSGAAYVYVKPSGGWEGEISETEKLLPKDGAADDELGRAVAISGNVIAVGSRYHDTDGKTDCGATYVFETQSGDWTDAKQTAKLTVSDQQEYDEIGTMVSMYKDYIIVGSQRSLRYTPHSPGAAYIYKKPKNGWTDTTEIAKLTGTDSELRDFFGCSVAMNENTVLVGALARNEPEYQLCGATYAYKKPAGEWENSIEVQKLLPPPYVTNKEDYYGFSGDIHGNYAVVTALNYNFKKGCAYVLENKGASWEIIAKLTPDDAESYSRYGYTASITDDYIAIGAYNKRAGRGAVYIYEKPAEGWTDMTETTILSSPTQVVDDNFGYSVDITQTHCIIGCPGYNSNTGCTYIFKKPESGWSNSAEYVTLTSSDGSANDYFGRSVSIDDKYIVIGQTSADSTGAAYVYEKNGENWADMTETAKLTSSKEKRDDFFGGKVDISGEQIIVGAFCADNLKGAAYIFEKPENGWLDTTASIKLSAKELKQKDFFGNSVSISDGYAMVGADGLGLIRNYMDIIPAYTPGAAYLFKRPESGWADTVETIKYVPDTKDAKDYFGCFVSVSGRNAMVGAWADDDGGTESGTAYMYRNPYAPVNITKEPEDISDVCINENVSFLAGGENIQFYQWQVSTNKGKTYVDLINNELTYKGVDTEKLSFVASKGFNGNTYRCIVRNMDHSDTSAAVTFAHETEAPSIVCANNQTKTLNAGENKYIVSGTEFDPVSSDDNCKVATVTNDFNNKASLEGAELPAGKNSIKWTVTDSAGNSTVCNLEVTIKKQDINSITNIEQLGIEFYPNPAKDFLKIDVHQVAIQNVRILDLTGKVLIKEPGILENTSFDLSTFKRGIYLLDIQVNNKHFINKIVKE